MKFRLNNFLEKNKPFVSIRLSLIIVLTYSAIPLVIYSPLTFPQALIDFDSSTGRGILGDVVKSAAGILSITVSILIISMQLLRTRYDDYAIRILFKKRSLRNTITLFVWSVILSEISIILLSKNISTTDFNRIYFSLILFIAAFGYLFSYLPNIIRSTNSTEIFKELLNRMDRNGVLDFIKSHPHPMKSDSKDLILFIEKKESSIITDLQRIGVLAIKNDDETGFEQYLEYRSACIKRLIDDSIENYQNSYYPQNIVELYRHYLLSPLSDRLTSNNNDRLLQNLIGETIDILKHCSGVGMLAYISSLSNYNLTILARQIQSKRLFGSWKVLIDGYRNFLNEIIVHFDDEVNFKLFRIGKLSVEGEVLNPETLEGQAKILKHFRFWHPSHIYSIIDQINLLHHKSIELREVQFVQSINDAYANLIFEIRRLEQPFPGEEINDLRHGRIRNKLSQSLKKAFVFGINTGMYTSSDIEFFLPIAVVGHPSYYKTTQHFIAIENYLDAVKSIAAKHLIKKEVFNEMVMGNRVLEAIDHYLKDFSNNREFVEKIINMLGEILSLMNNRDFAEFNDRILVKNQLSEIRKLMEENNISDPPMIDKIYQVIK